jgi:hypothetical protein
MNMHSHETSFRRRFEAAPSLLVAYAVFASLVTLASYVILPFAPDQLRESLIAYTGWNAGIPYPMTLIFVFVLIFQEQRRRYVRMFGIAFPLTILIVYGVYSFFQYGEPNYNNPYLTISPLRPVWTILIPAAWIVVLYLPTLNRFCNQPTEQKEA